MTRSPEEQVADAFNAYFANFEIRIRPEDGRYQPPDAPRREDLGRAASHAPGTIQSANREKEEQGG
jgi:hypothetical protein